MQSSDSLEVANNMDLVFCLVIKIINFILKVMFSWWIDLLIAMLSFLPASPIQFEPIKWGAFGNSIGYFIPVETMLKHFAAILTALTIWYGIQHILRILRMVR